MAENINRKLNIYINDKEVVNSMSGVTRAMAATRNEIRTLNKGADDYNERLAELKDTYNKLAQEQDNFKKQIAGVPSLLNKIKSELGPVASGMIAAFSVGALIAGFRSAFSGASKTIIDFEQKIADLKAITGVTGKDLEYLENRAIELGKQTKGGAEMVVEAYKLIASAKPELLENVKDLNAVTEAVLTLSQASGMELPEAATKLTDAMNQFNAPASEAALFVDALANGAKYGAAEIPEITESLLQFGAVARSTNVNIQESTALIELLAENGLKGAESGTALRNVLLKLSAPDALPKEAVKEFEKLGISMEFLKDQSIPIHEKMQALKPLLADNASIVKIFGTENATAAINIISHTDRLGELIGKMNEYGTAQEQADIKTNTLQGDLDKLASRYDSLVLSINKGTSSVANFARTAIQSLSNLLDFTALLFKDENQLTTYFKNLGKDKGSKEFEAVMRNITSATKEQQEATKKELLFRERENIRVNNAIVKAEKEKRASVLGGDRALFHLQTKLEEDALVQIGKSAQKIKLIKESTQKNTTKIPTGNSQTGQSVGNDDAEKAKKDREKELADAKRHSEDLLKQLEASKKELLATERSFDDLKLANQKEGYDKELALLNEESSRKIEDTKSKVSQLQEEINKLNADAKDPKNSKDDIAVIKATIANKIAAQIDYSASLIDIEQYRVSKVATLQEKYLQKDIQDQEDANARALQNLQTKHNNELSSITTLQDAKTVLSSYLSEDELKKVTTLEDAKKKVKQQFQEEELTLQQKHLVEMMAQIQAVFEQENIQGIELITPEQRELLLKFLDEAAAKLSGLGVSKAENNTEETDPSAGIKSLSGIDILGFTAEQWQGAFDNLDSFEGKMQALEVAVGAVKNAFGMYFQFLEAGEKRNLQKFEANNRKKQADLADQLEKGYITQEVYNARKAKLEAELAKKKAEIEFKQAKREKIMKASSIIANTAMGIMQIWGHSPDPTGISQGLLTAIISGIGAVNLGLVLAQPLPDKNGFYDGGYTGSGPERNSPGPVHYDEYVVPKKVLFSNDPVMPNIMSYLEAKRQGKTPQMLQDQNIVQDNMQSGSTPTQENFATIKLLDRAVDVLEKLEENGFQGYLVNDIKTAKKMRDKIKEVNKLESNAKL
jgi:TP901 family phage tail tape measure protein